MSPKSTVMMASDFFILIYYRVDSADDSVGNSPCPQDKERTDDSVPKHSLGISELLFITLRKDKLQSRPEEKYHNDRNGDLDQGVDDKPHRVGNVVHLERIFELYIQEKSRCLP